METLVKKVNVAPSSTEGHFVEHAKEVVNLDNVNETFMVKGKSVLTTKNHTSLQLEEDSMITCQRVYNPFSSMFERSKD